MYVVQLAYAKEKCRCSLSHEIVLLHHKVTDLASLNSHLKVVGFFPLWLLEFKKSYLPPMQEFPIFFHCVI